MDEAFDIAIGAPYLMHSYFGGQVVEYREHCEQSRTKCMGSTTICPCVGVPASVTTVVDTIN